MNNISSIHGVFLSIFNYGVLIIGKPGIGKSSLALELLDRSHQLIADDLVVFKSQEDSIIIGSAYNDFGDFLFIRDAGVIKTSNFFERSFTQRHCLNLVIELIKHLNEDEIKLEGNISKFTLLNKSFPKYKLSCSEGRCLAIIIETLVKRHKYNKNCADNFSKLATK